MGNNNDAESLHVKLPTINAYFNRVVDLLEAVRNLMASFSYNYSDMRVYLAVAERAGIVNWKKGTRFDTVQAPNFSSVAHNVVIHDLLQAILATPTEFKFDESIQT